jgi:SRSO17 transposase
MFKIKSIPKQIVSLIIELQIFFDDNQWLHFNSLLISLILTPYKSTINGMVKVLGFGTHRSKHNAFLLSSSEALIKALRYYAYFILDILKIFGEPIYFIIDDTSNKKRGKHIAGAYNYFDHISKKYIWGQQIVCSIILYRGITIPFGFAIYLTEQQCKELKIRFRKKTDIALELLKSFEPDCNQKVFVLADTYYATKDIINYSNLKKHNFISQLKSNRVFYINGYRTNVRKYLKNKSFKDKQKVRIGKNTYRAFSKRVNLKTGGVVKIVITKCTAHCTATVLFSTNTALSIYEIMEAYNKRWKIEIFFKMSKQHLGFNAYQSTDIKAINSHLCLSLFAHNLLTHAFINELRAKGKSLTSQKVVEKNISNLSILNMQNKFRFDANLESLNYCIEQSDIISKNKTKKEFKKYLVAA